MRQLIPEALVSAARLDFLPLQNRQLAEHTADNTRPRLQEPEAVPPNGTCGTECVR